LFAEEVNIFEDVLPMMLDRSVFLPQPKKRIAFRNLYLQPQKYKKMDFIGLFPFFPEKGRSITMPPSPSVVLYALKKVQSKCGSRKKARHICRAFLIFGFCKRLSRE
jgi:hypothetical protein